MNQYSPDRDIVVQLKNYSQVNGLRQMGYFALNWAFIFLVASLVHEYFSWPLYAIGIIFIAARQHALAVLVHDGAHYRIAKNKKINDIISNIFGSYGCLMGTHSYRVHHLNHHQYLNTDKDPDWARKIHLKEWAFPTSSSQLSRVLLRQLWRGGYEWIKLTTMMFRQNVKLSSADQRRIEAQLLFVFWTFVFIAAFALNLTHQLMIYWFVPLLTIFPLIQRIRSISEHFAVARDQILNRTRNVDPSFFEAFLLSPHSVNWHLVHHLYPAIPHFNLKKTQKLLAAESTYEEGQHLNGAYIFPFENSVLSDLVGRSQKRAVNASTEAA